MSDLELGEFYGVLRVKERKLEFLARQRRKSAQRKFVIIATRYAHDFGGLVRDYFLHCWVEAKDSGWQ
jgi:hypothetical protein